MSEYMSNAGFLVVIEWDGMKPPTPFYHRVRALTSGVRQDDSEDARSISPFARRAERNDNAVIMQEGAIYCTSKSLARALALLAQQYGAINVDMAVVDDLSPIEATKEDIEALSKINKVLGRRGRPPARRQRTLAVTCYEEIITKHVDTDKDVINCPSCGSLTVNVAYIENDTQADEGLGWNFYDKENSLFENWLGIRLFVMRRLMFYPVSYTDNLLDDEFEPLYFHHAPYGAEGKISDTSSMFTHSSKGFTREVLDKISQLPKHEGDILTMMARSNLNELDKFYNHPEILVRILDAILVAQLTLSDEERLEGRLGALSAAMIRYPDIASDYLLAPNKNSVDFFDASPIIPSKKMVEYFNHMKITPMPKLPQEEQENMPF